MVKACVRHPLPAVAVEQPEHVLAAAHVPPARASRGLLTHHLHFVVVIILVMVLVARLPPWNKEEVEQCTMCSAAEEVKSITSGPLSRLSGLCVEAPQNAWSAAGLAALLAGLCPVCPAQRESWRLAEDMPHLQCASKLVHAFASHQLHHKPWHINSNLHTLCLHHGC